MTISAQCQRTLASFLASINSKYSPHFLIFLQKLLLIINTKVLGHYSLFPIYLMPISDDAGSINTCVRWRCIFHLKIWLAHLFSLCETKFSITPFTPWAIQDQVLYWSICLGFSKFCRDQQRLNSTTIRDWWESQFFFRSSPFN